MEKKPEVVVVLHSYNAKKTLVQTVEDIPRSYVEEIILVDDHSRDDTVAGVVVGPAGTAGWVACGMCADGSITNGRAGGERWRGALE